MDQTDSSALSRDDSARDTDRAPTFQAPWASALLAIAFKTGSLTRAAEDVTVTLNQVYHLRNIDPAFAAALRDFDVHRKQLILNRIEDAAATGDLKAIKVLTEQREELLALVRDNAQVPGRDGIPQSVAAAAMHAYWDKRDELMARLKGMEPSPPLPVELNAAVICPNCKIALGPWHAGDDVQANLTTYFTEVLEWAWRYAKLTEQRPPFATILPDPYPDQAATIVFNVPKEKRYSIP